MISVFVGGTDRNFNSGINTNVLFLKIVKDVYDNLVFSMRQRSFYCC